MYAFLIGYHLGECAPITGLGASRDFAPINHWKPSDLVDFILMLLFTETEDKLGFSWAQLEEMSDEECKAVVSNIIRRLEGYANTGLNYIQDKFENAKEEFRSPYVFINLLRDVVQSKEE